MSSKKINLSLNKDIKQPILKNFFSSKVKSQDNRFVRIVLLQLQHTSSNCLKDLIKLLTVIVGKDQTVRVLHLQACQRKRIGLTLKL